MRRSGLCTPTRSPARSSPPRPPPPVAHMDSWGHCRCPPHWGGARAACRLISAHDPALASPSQTPACGQCHPCGEGGCSPHRAMTVGGGASETPPAPPSLETLPPTEVAAKVSSCLLTASSTRLWGDTQLDQVHLVRQ